MEISQDGMLELYAEWDESQHPRGKTSPSSTPGSFRPSEAAFNNQIDQIAVMDRNDPLVVGLRQRKFDKLLRKIQDAYDNLQLNDQEYRRLEKRIKTEEPGVSTLF